MVCLHPNEVVNASGRCRSRRRDASEMGNEAGTCTPLMSDIERRACASLVGTSHVAGMYFFVLEVVVPPHCGRTTKRPSCGTMRPRSALGTPHSRPQPLYTNTAKYQAKFSAQLFNARHLKALDACSLSTNSSHRSLKVSTTSQLTNRHGYLFLWTLRLL